MTDTTNMTSVLGAITINGQDGFFNFYIGRYTDSAGVVHLGKVQFGFVVNALMYWDSALNEEVTLTDGFEILTCP